MNLDVHTVDVFTEHQFGGNPLAVLTHAEGLSTEEMQAIAGEFNLSETTFVLPPADPMHTARVRIFTPRNELPFAGHPNVGTAYVLARIGEIYGSRIIGDTLVFEEGAGPVDVTIERDAGEIVGARLQAPQTLALWSGPPDCPSTEDVARACGLSVDDVSTVAHAPVIGSCGTRFALAEVTDRKALRRAHPVPSVFARELPADVATGLHLYCVEPGNANRLHARMFAPEQGVMEDPATGSANVILAGLRLSISPDAGDEAAFDIFQGEDMGRLSVMRATAYRDKAGAIHTTIGGQCRSVMRGTLSLTG